MSENKEKLHNTLKTVKYMLQITLSRGKKWLVLKTLEKIMNAVYPLAGIILPGYIMNELIETQNIKRIIFYILLLGLTVFCGKWSSTWLSAKCFSLKNLLFIDFQKSMMENIASINYEYLENPDTLNLKESADKCAYSNGIGFLGIIERIADLFGNVISLFTISTIIFTLNPIIIIILLLVIYLNSIVTKKVNMINYQLDIDKIPYERKGGYFSRIMQDFGYGKEIRIFNLKDFFIHKYEKEALNAHEYYKKTIKNNNIVSIFSNFLSLLQTVFVYGYLAYEVLLKYMTIGNFSIYYAAITNFSDAFFRVVSTFLEVSRLSLYVDDLIKFMNLPRTQLLSGNKTVTYHEDSEIIFKNVSFRYPGSDSYVLKDLNFTIHGKEKLCIVGTNGSGKTTFIKLLLRLYNPTSGEILLNGVNIKEYDYIEYQKIFSPVFQDFNLFAMTMKENILLNEKEEIEKFEDSCKKSSVDILLNKLKERESTHIYKIFSENGIEPSGGEAQKIAITRAIYRDSPIVVLDEPTAALDPIAEYEIYKKFSEMISERAAILITHRLSAVQLSDVVAVFDKGKLIEYGKHQELLEKNGVYADMYQKQGEFYRNEASAI